MLQDKPGFQREGFEPFRWEQMREMRYDPDFMREIYNFWKLFGNGV